EEERHRADRREHEGAPASERRVERVAPRSDHGREREREDPLRAEERADQTARPRELVAQERRQVRRGRRDREREPEGAEPERPEQTAAPSRQRDDALWENRGHQPSGWPVDRSVKARGA